MDYREEEFSMHVEYGTLDSGTVSHFLTHVYGWMMLGLGVTAATAYSVAATPALLEKVVTTPFLFYGIFIAQLALVIVLSVRLMRMSFAAAAATFLAYAVLTGVTFSVLFLIFELSSLGFVFLITAGMFGCMATYGYLTRADLSGMRGVLLLGLFGLIIGGLVNMYFKSNTADFVLSIVGVVVFCLLTAYDMQRLKGFAQRFAGDAGLLSRGAILGALMLYLDFINLFLRLLQLLGKRKR